MDSPWVGYPPEDPRSNPYNWASFDKGVTWEYLGDTSAQPSSMSLPPAGIAGGYSSQIPATSSSNLQSGSDASQNALQSTSDYLMGGMQLAADTVTGYGSDSASASGSSGSSGSSQGNSLSGGGGGGGFGGSYDAGATSPGVYYTPSLLSTTLPTPGPGVSQDVLSYGYTPGGYNWGAAEPYPGGGAIPAPLNYDAAEPDTGGGRIPAFPPLPGGPGVGGSSSPWVPPMMGGPGYGGESSPWIPPVGGPGTGGSSSPWTPPASGSPTSPTPAAPGPGGTGVPPTAGAGGSPAASAVPGLGAPSPASRLPGSAVPTPGQLPATMGGSGRGTVPPVPQRPAWQPSSSDRSAVYLEAPQMAAPPREEWPLWVRMGNAPALENGIPQGGLPGYIVPSVPNIDVTKPKRPPTRPPASNTRTRER